MKKRYKILTGKGLVEKEYNHIPIRYLIAVGIAVLEILAIIGVVLALCYYLPWFYFLSLAVNAYCVVKIISSDDNPDYKIPWLLCVIILPIAGFMLYFMFYSRKLKPKFLHRVGELSAYKYHYDDSAIFDKL